MEASTSPILPVTPKDHSLGREEAEHSLVIYGDYECPYTRVEYRIAKQYLNRFEAKLRLTFRHFPLINLHPQALIAAEAAAFQGKFWAMSDILFDHQERLEEADLLSYAMLIGLDTAQYEQAIVSKTALVLVQQSLREGKKAGVRGIPAIYLDGHYVGSQVRKPLLSMLNL